MKTLALPFALIVAGTLSALAQVPTLSLQRTIPLPGVTGKFDHFAIDIAANRLFVAATGNHSVEVIDLKSGKVQQSLAGLGKPHGLVWDASTHRLFVADGSLAQLLVYQVSSDAQLQIAGKIALSDDADDMVYDETRHLLFVGTGGSDAANAARVAVIDTASLSIAANIPVATHPEALDIDIAGQRVFANIAESSKVAVIDEADKSLHADWILSNASDNVPMAYDSDDQVLFLACRTPAVLIALDGNTGKELSRIPIGSGADDLFYDRVLHRLYVISGAGEVDVVQASPKKALSNLQTIHTAIGAKTALYVPSQSMLYVGVPGSNAAPATIRAYSTLGAGK